MKLFMVATDTEGQLVISFPIFVQNFNKMPLTLYEIESVKVPIEDQNFQADSCSEVKIAKLYIAINKTYYNPLRIQELGICKQIRYTYYCEELFLVKHKAKHSCERTIFYKLDKDTIKRKYHYRYLYNTTVIPSVLDGGTQIVLANMGNNKKLFLVNKWSLTYYKIKLVKVATDTEAQLVISSNYHISHILILFSHNKMVKGENCRFIFIANNHLENH